MAHSGKLGKKKKQWDGGSVSWIRNRMESKVSRPRMSDNDAHWLAKTTKSKKKGGEEALENERERERISCVSRRKKSRSRKEKKEKERAKRRIELRRKKKEGKEKERWVKISKSWIERTVRYVYGEVRSRGIRAGNIIIRQVKEPKEPERREDKGEGDTARQRQQREEKERGWENRKENLILRCGWNLKCSEGALSSCHRHSAPLMDSVMVRTPYFDTRVCTRSMPLQVCYVRGIKLD